MYSLIINEIKDFLRDRTNLFFFILFPMVLIFLLGNLLTGMDQAEDAIGTIEIQYMIDSTDQYQKLAVDRFIAEAGKDNASLRFEEISDIDHSKLLAGKDEITAVVVFTGNPMEIQIYEGTNQIKNKAVDAVFCSFVQTDKAYKTVMAAGIGVSPGGGQASQEYVEEKDLGIQRTMIDYYAVTMLAMMCFTSILVGAGAFMGERQNKTINRLIISPQNRIQLFLQKIIGMLPQIILQIIIIMLISVFLYHAQYANNLTDNLYLFFMFFTVALCMISIGAATGIVLNANPMTVIMPILWAMMFFGGTYSRYMNINGVTQYMPIYQVQQAAYDLAIFGHRNKAAYVIIICLAVTAAALITGAFLFGRKQEER